MSARPGTARWDCTRQRLESKQAHKHPCITAVRKSSSDASHRITHTTPMLREGLWQEWFNISHFIHTILRKRSKHWATVQLALADQRDTNVGALRLPAADAPRQHIADMRVRAPLR